MEDANPRRDGVFHMEADQGGTGLGKPRFFLRSPTALRIHIPVKVIGNSKPEESPITFSEGTCSFSRLIVCPVVGEHVWAIPCANNTKNPSKS